MSENTGTTDAVLWSDSGFTFEEAQRRWLPRMERMKARHRAAGGAVTSTDPDPDCLATIDAVEHSASIGGHYRLIHATDGDGYAWVHTGGVDDPVRADYIVTILNRALASGRVRWVRGDGVGRVNIIPPADNRED